MKQMILSDYYIQRPFVTYKYRHMKNSQQMITIYNRVFYIWDASILSQSTSKPLNVLCANWEADMADICSMLCLSPECLLGRCQNLLDF